METHLCVRLDPKNFEGGPAATPTIDGDSVYTFSRKGHLYALSAVDGKVIWSKNLAEELGATVPTWGLSSSALIEGDLLILNIGSAGAALEKKTGKIVWKSGSDAAGYATPVPFMQGSDRCLAIMGKHRSLRQTDRWCRIVELSLENLLRRQLGRSVFDGDRVFISSGYIMWSRLKGEWQFGRKSLGKPQHAQSLQQLCPVERTSLRPRREPIAVPGF